MQSGAVIDAKLERDVLDWLYLAIEAPLEALKGRVRVAAVEELSIDLQWRSCKGCRTAKIP